MDAGASVVQWPCVTLAPFRLLHVAIAPTRADPAFEEAPLNRTHAVYHQSHDAR